MSTVNGVEHAQEPGGIFIVSLLAPFTPGLWFFCVGGERGAESVMSFLLLWEENIGRGDED